MKLLLWSCLPLALAFPLGAPNCPLDGAAPGSSHRPVGFTLQDFEAGKFKVLVNGCEMDPSKPIPVKVFQPLTIKIRRTEGRFKGVLARLNVDQGIGLLPNNRNRLQISEPCSRENAIGVTHTNRNRKKQVGFKVVFMEPNDDIQMAVDTVEVNTKKPTKSVFFHDMFRFQADFDNKKISVNSCPS